MTLVVTILAVGGAYLLGSIPIGLLVCRLQGLDPRLVGSGRTGGTNVFRTAGLPAAIITVLGDILKGYIAVALADQLYWQLLAGATGALGLGSTSVDPAAAHPWALALAALAVIVGHNYSVSVGFRGGAGSSPNIGALLWFDPTAFGAALVLAAICMFGIRIASVASLALSLVIVTSISYRVHGGDLPLAVLAYGAGQLLLVAWALRPNIARLRAGTERRLQFGQPRAESAASRDA